MRNHLELSAAFIRAMIAKHPKAQTPITHELKLAFGMKARLTIDLKQLDIVGDEIQIPVQASKLPDFTFVLSGLTVRDGVVWVKPELRGVPLPLNLAELAPKMAEKAGLNPSDILTDGDLVGADPLKLRPDLPAKITTLTIADGIEVELDLIG